MTSFLIVKILDDRSFMLPSTFVYGDVELRSSSTDTALESNAFEESASESGLDISKYKICARIATIIDCDTSREALYIAENKFHEVLDLKSIEFAVSAIKTSKIGLIKNLDTGEINPIKKLGFEQSMTFVVGRGRIQCFDLPAYLLTLNNELSDRYKRSLHWARNSKNEINPQLKILFLWFSLEALLKNDESDNSVESFVRLFLGFPNGQQLLSLSPSIRKSLDNHPRYNVWQRKIKDLVIQIRDFRNNSVHSGFRSVDFTRDKLNLFTVIMTYAVSRCQAGVMEGLVNEITTLSVFKDYAVPILRAIKT